MDKTYRRGPGSAQHRTAPPARPPAWADLPDDYDGPPPVEHGYVGGAAPPTPDAGQAQARPDGEAHELIETPLVRRQQIREERDRRIEEMGPPPDQIPERVEERPAPPPEGYPGIPPAGCTQPGERLDTARRSASRAGARDESDAKRGEGATSSPPHPAPYSTDLGGDGDFAEDHLQDTSSSYVLSLWFTYASRDDDEENADKCRQRRLSLDLTEILGEDRAPEFVRLCRGLYNSGPVRDLERAIRIRREEVLWSWQSWQIEQGLLTRRVFEAILRYSDDPVVRRYLIFCLVSSWRDGGTGELCIPWQAAAWIMCGEVSKKRFYSKETLGTEYTGLEGLIRYLNERLPGEVETRAAIPKRRVTLLKRTGLPEELVELYDECLASEAGEDVRAGDGKAFDPKKSPSRLRKEFKARAARQRFPSPTARRIAAHLNGLPADRFTRQFKDGIAEARAHVKEMEISVKLSEDEARGLPPAARARKQAEKNAEQRREYLEILRHIERQAKPFYRPSRKGRTDRIFSLGRSILLLPKGVRKILSSGLYEVDLISAHLVLAAWLWGAESVLERLTEDGFDLWQELIGYYEEEITACCGEMPEKGSDLWEDVKAALKVALYSTVYGMHAPSVKGQFTRRMKGFLGEKAGTKLGRHPLIADLLEARDEKLAELEVGQTLIGPTGIRVRITQSMDSDGDGVDAKSAMATTAQSCEQFLMKTIPDVIEERERTVSRNHLKLYLWIHDGAYLGMRSPRARGKELQARLDERAEELRAWAEASEHWSVEGAPPVAFEIEKL